MGMPIAMRACVVGQLQVQSTGAMAVVRLTGAARSRGRKNNAGHAISGGRNGDGRT